MNANAIILSGGGLKSAAIAARYATKRQLVFVHGSYGQRSSAMELQAIRSLVAVYPGARLVELELPHLMRVQEQLEAADRGGASSFASGIVGSHVLHPSSMRGLLPVLLQAAVQCAWRVGATEVITGLSRRVDPAHLGFQAGEGRADRMREFLHAYNVMLDTCAAPRNAVVIESPLMDLAYPEIIRLCAHFRVPFERTWTCERGQNRPCGRCQPCSARTHAFLEAGVADPAAAMASAGAGT